MQDIIQCFDMSYKLSGIFLDECVELGAKLVQIDPLYI